MVSQSRWLLAKNNLILHNSITIPFEINIRSGNRLKLNQQRHQEQVAVAEAWESTIGLIDAIEAEIELTKEKGHVLQSKLQVLQSKSDVEKKEKHPNRLITTERAIRELEDKLTTAQQNLTYQELQWRENWDEWEVESSEIHKIPSGMFVPCEYQQRS